MIDEKTHMWYILSGRYGDLAWEMLKDITGEKINYKKANKHLKYIMQNWGSEEVCRTMRTWLVNSDIDSNKFNHQLSLEFRDKYSQYVADNKESIQRWPKPENFDKI